MPCDCGKPTTLRSLMSVRSKYPSNGGWPLGIYPECTELYDPVGPSAGLAIYVCGRGTEFEKLFKKSELAAATIWCREHKVQVDPVTSTALCAQAVIDVYGQ